MRGLTQASCFKSYDMQVSSFLLQRDVPSLSNFLVTFNDTEAFFTKWSNFYYGILKNLSWCQRERSCGLGMQRPEAPTWGREQSQLCLYTGQNQRWPIEISGAGTWDVNCQHAASGNVRLPWHCCWPHALKLRAAGDSKYQLMFIVSDSAELSLAITEAIWYVSCDRDVAVWIKSSLIWGQNKIKLFVFPVFPPSLSDDVICKRASSRQTLALTVKGRDILWQFV